MKGVAEVKGWNRQALPTSRLGQFTLVLSRPAVSKRRSSRKPGRLVAGQRCASNSCLLHTSRLRRGYGLHRPRTPTHLLTAHERMAPVALQPAGLCRSLRLLRSFADG